MILDSGKVLADILLKSNNTNLLVLFTAMKTCLKLMKHIKKSFVYEEEHLQVVTKLTLVLFGIERHLHEWFNYSLYKTATKVLMIVMKYFLNINQPTNNLDYAMLIMYYVLKNHSEKNI